MGNTVDILTDNRTYYNCPGCGQRVWAYGSWVGNRCWDCPGTLFDGVIRSNHITSTVSDVVTDRKIRYTCNRCGKEKWAYGGGYTCLDCRNLSYLNISDTKTKAVLIYDDTNRASKWGETDDPTWMWKYAASFRPDYDYKIPAKSWNEAFKRLGAICKTDNVYWVEFWGHGYEATAAIGNEDLKWNDFKYYCNKYGITKHDFKKGKRSFSCSTPLWWFRTCSTAKGSEGKKFLCNIRDLLEINVYGHCVNIGGDKKKKNTSSNTKEYSPGHGGICKAPKYGGYLHNIGGVSTVAVCPE